MAKRTNTKRTRNVAETERGVNTRTAVRLIKECFREQGFRVKLVGEAEDASVSELDFEVSTKGLVEPIEVQVHTNGRKRLDVSVGPMVFKLPEAANIEDTFDGMTCKTGAGLVRTHAKIAKHIKHERDAIKTAFERRSALTKQMLAAVNQVLTLAGHGVEQTAR